MADQWPDTVTQKQMEAHLGREHMGPKTSLVMVSKPTGYRFYKRESDGLWYRLSNDERHHSGTDA